MVTLAFTRWLNKNRSVKPPIILSLILASLLSFAFVHTAQAADPPTYSLEPNIKITAKGGYLSEGDLPLFYKDDGKWKYSAIDGQTAKGFYNESKQEVYFNYNSKLQLYVTKVTQYLNQQAVRAGQDLCYVAISVPPSSTTDANFTGVSAKGGTETKACKEAVQKFLGPSVKFQAPKIDGETFMGVSIETCSSRTGNCVDRRANQLKQLANAISCSTSSADAIKECEYNKNIQKCLEESPTNKVSYCKSLQEARKILDGDLSAITAETTDDFIKDLCGTLKSDEEKKKCTDDATAQRDELKGDTTEEDKSSCNIDGIGWVLCPVLTFMAKLNDSAFGFLNNFLEVPASLIKDKATFTAWQTFRDFANVMFVIAFMFVIYSQLTGAGITNYGLKKLLPKIVIAAILVNVSYFICAILVDVSNIVGSSIYGLLKGIDVGGAGGDSAGGLWEGLVVGALAIGAIIILFGIVLVAPVSLLAFALTLFILIARQALVVLLVVTSPIAFVLYLLPNTEQYFKKWWNALKVTLMVYPIIGLVFGASYLASGILTRVAGDGGQGGDDNTMLAIVALGVLAVPLFAVPGLLKGALSATGAVGAKIAGIQDKLNRSTAAGAKAGGKYLADKGFGAAYQRGGRLAKVAGFASGDVKRAKYDAMSRKRKGYQQNYLNTNGKTAARERDALLGEEAGSLASEINKNVAKSQGLQDHHDLHTAATTSGLKLHDEEAVHKSQATQTYLATPAGGQLRAAAVQAGASSSNAEETVKNNAIAEHIRQNPGQYDALSESKGMVKTAQTEQGIRFENSIAGRTQANQQQDLDDQLAIVKDQQSEDYKTSEPGLRNAQAKKVSGKRVEIADGIIEQNYLDSDDGQVLSIKGGVIQEKITALKSRDDAVLDELRAGPESAAATVARLDTDLPGLGGAEQIALDMSAADVQKRVQTQRQESAKKQATSNFVDTLVTSDGTPTQVAIDAAGIQGSTGASRVAASAKAAQTKEMMENIQNIQSTMPFEDSSNPERLQQLFNDPGSTTEQKIAYLKAMYKAGSPGVRATRDTLTDWTNDPNPSPEKLEEIAMIKEVMQDDQGFQRAGRDFEVWSNNEHSVTTVDPVTGDTVNSPHASFGEVSNDLSVWADISAQRFASMNKASQTEALRRVQTADPAAYAKLVDRIVTDTTALGQIKEGPRELIRTSRQSRNLDFPT